MTLVVVNFENNGEPIAYETTDEWARNVESDWDMGNFRTKLVDKDDDIILIPLDKVLGIVVSRNG